MILSATSHHIPVIQSIAHRTWPVAYGNLLSPEQLTYMLDMMYSTGSLTQQMEKGHQFYLALQNDEPVGFASVSDEGEGVFKLNKLYVLPDIQGSGAGKALLLQCIDYATKHNGRQLILQVKRDNPSRSFYEKHGFTILHELDLDVGGGFFMNDYVMGRELIKN